MRQPLLHVSDVSKRFGDVVALDQVSLDIYEGDIIGLVGSNGAGKTTLLRLLAGVYRPSSGRVHLADDADVEQARARLGVVPENTGLYARLTAWENIRYHARIHGVPDDLAWKRTRYFAHHLQMEDALSRHTKGFSRGMRQKTALLRALAPISLFRRLQLAANVFLRTRLHAAAPHGAHGARKGAAPTWQGKKAAVAPAAPASGLA